MKTSCNRHYQRGPLCRDDGYIKIYSNFKAFAALKADGSITAWGGSDYGGKGAKALKFE
jgi:hypothetical protein